MSEKIDLPKALRIYPAKLGASTRMDYRVEFPPGTRMGAGNREELKTRLETMSSPADCFAYTFGVKILGKNSLSTVRKLQQKMQRAPGVIRSEIEPSDKRVVILTASGDWRKAPDNLLSTLLKNGISIGLQAG